MSKKIMSTVAILVLLTAWFMPAVGQDRALVGIWFQSMDMWEGYTLGQMAMFVLMAVMCATTMGGYTYWGFAKK